MNKKYKILIVHNQYQIPGGEDTVVENERELLEEYGHEVLLYSRNNNEIRRMSKLQKLFLPITFIYNPKTYQEIKDIIKGNKIDIIHIHNTLNLISPAVYYAALACKTPIVQTIHNFRMLCPAATFYRAGHICEECIVTGLKCAIKNSCYRESRLQTLACVLSIKLHRLAGIYKRMDYICLTEFNKKKLLEQIQIKESQIYVKPNFVKTCNRIIPYEERKKQFIFVGRLDKLKGIDLLLQAWKQLGGNAPELIVCGTGPLDEWCRCYVEENQLTNVKLMGFVKNEQALSIIGESKVLVLPTQCYEGFPMSIVEAYSVGTPVIGSDIGNVGNIIKEDVTGWRFRHDSVEDLVNVMRYEHDIVKSVVAEYENKYTAKKNYELFVEIYNAINC